MARKKRKSEYPAAIWRLETIGSGLLPLAAMLVPVEQWANSYFIVYVVTMAVLWCVRVINLYKLLGPKADEYQSLATRRWGRGAAFLVFFSSVLLIVTTFATFYWGLSGRTFASFTEPLSRVDAIYFAATIFTTTGFGDIAAASQLARFAVTLQMLFGFGLVVGAIGVAISRGRLPSGPD